MYIKEAHPVEGPRPSKRVEINQPKTFEERKEVAAKCVKELGLTMPVLIDDMKNTVATAYGAMPDRLFVVSPDAKIAFTGARGPKGFSVPALSLALATSAK